MRSTRLHQNIPWRFFVENRTAHYVAHVQEKDEWAAPSPYLLMNDYTAKVAYAIGAKARQEELFHFELLRRLDRWLTFDCPFGGVEWSLAVRQRSAYQGNAAAIPFPAVVSKATPTKGSYAALEQNRDVFKSYVLDHASALQGLVDRDAVAA